MTTIGERLTSGLIQATYSIPFSAIGGWLGGYVYGKLADLPAHQTAKAWAIWGAAAKALTLLVNILTESLQLRALGQLIFGVGSSAIFITEMRKRELLGNKMMAFLIIADIIATIILLPIACGAKPPASVAKALA